MPRHVAPEVFMQLQLQPDRQPVLQDPFGQLGRILLLLSGGEQDFTAGREIVFPEAVPGPFIILPVADDELDLVGAAQRYDVRITVALHFARARRLQVHHLDDARIDAGDIECPAGLKRDAVTGITQLPQQRQAGLLRQRLAPGHRDIAGPVAGYPFQDGTGFHPLASLEGVGGIAITATQWTTRETNKDGRAARGQRFPLQGIKNFGNPQTIGHGLCAICRAPIMLP